MGLPVVAAATPAYREAMTEVGTPELACVNDAEWILAIERMMSDEDLRRDSAERGRKYAETVYGPDAILARWDSMFASIGFSFDTQSEQATAQAAIP
jgi:glycosyltransferase involved in cell wall biosynthesis